MTREKFNEAAEILRFIDQARSAEQSADDLFKRVAQHTFHIEDMNGVLKAEDFEPLKDKVLAKNRETLAALEKRFDEL